MGTMTGESSFHEEMKVADEKKCKASKEGRPRRMRLVTRDIQLLSFMGEHGCVSPGRIKRYFWNSSETSRAHNRRLRILANRGLVEKVLGDQERLLGYRLTIKGKRTLKEMAPGLKFFVARRAYKTQFEHDQRLIDLRRILEQSPHIRNFKMDHELQAELSSGAGVPTSWRNAQLVPDALFVHRTSKQCMRIALELEMTQKSRQRYGRIFQAHLLAKKWDLTLYVVRDDTLRIRLMQILDTVKGKDLEVRLAKVVNGIYFCSLDEFLSKGLEASMTNGKREISFAEMARNVGTSG
jgi:hypothetical protein